MDMDTLKKISDMKSVGDVATDLRHYAVTLKKNATAQNIKCASLVHSAMIAGAQVILVLGALAPVSDIGPGDLKIPAALMIALQQLFVNLKSISNVTTGNEQELKEFVDVCAAANSQYDRWVDDFSKRLTKHVQVGIKWLEETTPAWQNLVLVQAPQPQEIIDTLLSAPIEAGLASSYSSVKVLEAEVLDCNKRLSMRFDVRSKDLMKSLGEKLSDGKA